MTPFYERDGITIYCGDCLEVMPQLELSFDAIIADLPYGTTACEWDIIISLELLWEQYKKAIKDNRCIALFGSEPFSSILRMSNIKSYRYDWYWDKKFGGNFVQAKRMPLKSIECISIFSVGKKMPEYYPQMINRKIAIKQGGIRTSSAIPIKNNAQTHTGKVYDKKYPVTRLIFPKSLGKTVHPTQKPIALFEYLIKTYTNEGNIILDNAMGSGTTLVAAQNEGRQAVGIEIDEEYCKVAVERLRQPSFFSFAQSQDKQLEPEQLMMRLGNE